MSNEIDTSAVGMNTVDIMVPADQREGTHVVLQQWLVKAGDTVSANDPLAELETDKVTMEVCAPIDGTVMELLVSPGTEIEAETILGRLTKEAGSTLYKNELSAQLSQVEPSNSSQADAAPLSLRDSQYRGDAKHLLGPAVRRLLREYQLDINLISGSGRGGRITREDVTTYIEKNRCSKASDMTTASSTSNATFSTAHAATVDPQNTSANSYKIPHSTMRKAIASHMVDSLLHTSPHVTSVFEMDMSNIIEHRKWHKKEFQEKGINLTFTAYFLAASVAAIKSVPQVNAQFHDDALEVFKDINIGIGTALDDKGLVVPVIHNVQNMDLLTIAQALQQQTQKAKTGKLVQKDFQQGTFTISNHGVSGSLFATPIIINQPQVAILGIGKMQKRTVVEEMPEGDQINIKPMCYVSLTIDHRALDAYQTNLFLSQFVKTIEHWGEI